MVEPETIVDAPTHANDPLVVRRVLRSRPLTCPVHLGHSPGRNTCEQRTGKELSRYGGRPVHHHRQRLELGIDGISVTTRSSSIFRVSLGSPARRRPVAAGPRPAFARRLIQTSGASSGNLVATNNVLGGDQEQQGTIIVRRSRTFISTGQPSELRKCWTCRTELASPDVRPALNL